MGDSIKPGYTQWFSALAAVLCGCASTQSPPPPASELSPGMPISGVEALDENHLEKVFGDLHACLLVRDLKSDRVIAAFHPENCAVREYACSTFKIPLAIMGFDSGILRDEHTTFKWDGSEQPFKAWERDTDARGWLKNSVVWYSQRITPKLGMRRISVYLKDFAYGNRDFSGGIKKAWLSSTLKISPREQLDFLTRVQKHDLRVKPGAIDKTLSILPVAVEKPGVLVAGKTGSGFSWKDPHSQSPAPYRVGWYIGYLSEGEARYAFVVSVREPSKPGDSTFEGPRAEKLLLSALNLEP